MPKAKRRCSRDGCKLLQPCPVKGHQRGQSLTPLPTNWKSLVKAVRKRDRDVCQECKILTPHPEIDHIVPRWKRPDLAADMRYLRVLCPSCHKVKSKQDRQEWRIWKLRKKNV